jgi:hypothetical protein
MSLTATFGPYIIGTAAAVLAFGYLRRQRASSSLPLPPGPKRLPVIGNLLDLPKEFEWLTYQQWTDAFGDVIYVEALGQKLVILGSAQAVDDLLERRSAIYSDRIVTPMIDMCVCAGRGRARGADARRAGWAGSGRSRCRSTGRRGARSASSCTRTCTRASSTATSPCRSRPRAGSRATCSRRTTRPRCSASSCA